MHLPFVFGLNYETAEFDIREKLAFSREMIPTVLQRLQSSGLTQEILILSTCNRTEVYCITPEIDFVINAICDIQNVCPRTVKKHSYVYSGLDCANHLFRVVSGLESMVLGETEIVAQTKDAFNLAKDQNSIHTQLSGLFQMALAVEKDVRNATEINNVAISVGNVLVNMVAENMDNLVAQSILFIGAGKMMAQIAPHFKSINFVQKTIANRTPEHAKMLATRINAEAIGLINLPDIINNYSIMIVCCGSDKQFLDANMLREAITAEKKTLIIDLSMPLVTSLSLRKYNNINLLTIDDIAKIVDVGVEKRKIAALEADHIINDKITEYQNWLKKRELTPLIKALRDNADDIRQEELLFAQKQLQNGEDIAEILKMLSLRLTNKLLHAPTVNLCATSGTLQENLTGLVSYLYNLNSIIK